MVVRFIFIKITNFHSFLVASTSIPKKRYGTTCFFLFHCAVDYPMTWIQSIPKYNVVEFLTGNVSLLIYQKNLEAVAGGAIRL